jgi:hypothetical protein
LLLGRRTSEEGTRQGAFASSPELHPPPKCAVRPMRRGAFGPIIVVVRTNLKTAAKEAVPLREVGTQASDRPASVTVAVCGDPVVGRALALLLQPARYEARFVPVIASGEPGPLGDAQVVVLVPTPGLNVRQREALVGAVREREPSIPVLELVTCWPRAEPGRGTVPWPCSTEELQQRIENALWAAACDGGQGS